MKKFFTPDLSDKRIYYAAQKLEELGYSGVSSSDNADFILLGVNPKKELLEFDVPIFAGNISGRHIFDYTKNEAFAIENAYLTAEGAVALAAESSAQSLVNSRILIVGYGRIGKALHKYLNVFTGSITVCARNENARTLAQANGAFAVDFDHLKNCGKYDFIFNTVPHPVFNEKELKSVNSNAALLDLASFPGGADLHIAKYYNINLIVARNLPAKYSPKAAGIIVAKTVDKAIKEVIV